MARVHVKKGDTVVVISGAAKGSRGEVAEVDCAKNRVIVKDVNKHQTTLRKTRENSQGGLEEVEMPIHASNVMLAEKYDAKRGGND